MHIATSRCFSSMRSIGLTAGLLAVGYCFGAAGGPPQPANAGVRESAPRKAFQSGGSRSEVVLKDISATLKRIEARVGAIEKSVTARVGK